MFKDGAALPYLLLRLAPCCLPVLRVALPATSNHRRIGSRNAVPPIVYSWPSTYPVPSGNETVAPENTRFVTTANLPKRQTPGPPTKSHSSEYVPMDSENDGILAISFCFSALLPLRRCGHTYWFARNRSTAFALQFTLAFAFPTHPVVLMILASHSLLNFWDKPHPCRSDIRFGFTSLAR